MKRIILIGVVALLTGCGSIANIIPSFWDDNQSSRIIDVRMAVANIDCAQPQLPQAQAIAGQLKWFELYSESKGRRQQDVILIITPMQESVLDWIKRSQDSTASVAYCTIKKKLLESQSRTAASAVLGRF